MAERRTQDRAENGNGGSVGQEEARRALLLAAKAGNQKAYAELLTQYKPLISSMVNRYRSEEMPEQETEDLREEAVISFCHAVERYDMEQSEVGFGLYAKICIANGLISYLREMKKRSIPTETLGETVEEFSDPSVSVIEEENFRALHSLIEKTLTDYENAVWWSYMSGMTAKEIGEQYGTGEKSAANAVYRIRRKLRRLFDRT